jgi:hypothetical protein
MLFAGTIDPVTPTKFFGEMNVTCLTSPDNCFDVVNSTIANAASSIWISVYTLSSPYLVETLLERVAGGIDVKLLLEDDQVSSYEKNYTRSTMYNLTVLGRGGNVAEGKLASDTFTFQHCKYAIIDNATLIISSGNWGMKSCPPEQADGDVDGNRDWWFIIHGNGTVTTGNDDTSGGNDGTGEDDVIGEIDGMPGWLMIIIIVPSVAGIGSGVMTGKKGREKKLRDQ